MNLDIKLLDAFCSVMENRSITLAATVLGVTQPAVSAQMSRLEKQTGFPLFERVGSRLRPTAEGLQFYQEVTRAMGVVGRLERAIETIRDGRSGRLFIASHPSASISVLPDVVPKFARLYPDATIKMINRSSEAVRALFPGGPADIGIAETPVELSGIELQRYSIACVAILPHGHPAAAHKIIRPSDLAGEPFIAMAPSRLTGHRIRSAFIDSGCDFKLVLESEYFTSICRLVANGLGVSVVDGWSARTFRDHGLAVRPFEPAIFYEIGVFTSLDPAPTVLARAFLKLLDAELKGESTTHENTP